MSLSDIGPACQVPSRSEVPAGSEVGAGLDGAELVGPSAFSPASVESSEPQPTSSIVIATTMPIVTVKRLVRMAFSLASGWRQSCSWTIPSLVGGYAGSHPSASQAR